MKCVFLVTSPRPVWTWTDFIVFHPPAPKFGPSTNIDLIVSVQKKTLMVFVADDEEGEEDEGEGEEDEGE